MTGYTGHCRILSTQTCPPPNSPNCPPHSGTVADGRLGHGVSNRPVGHPALFHRRWIASQQRQGSLLKVRANHIERVIVDPERPGSSVIGMSESPFCATLAQGLFCQDESGQFQLMTAFEPGLAVRQGAPRRCLGAGSN